MRTVDVAGQVAPDDVLVPVVAERTGPDHADRVAVWSVVALDVFVTAGRVKSVAHSLYLSGVITETWQRVKVVLFTRHLIPST